MSAVSAVSKKILNSGETIKTKITKVKSEGIEIVVKLENITVKSYWFKNPSAVYAGDSSLFSVFFPVPVPDSDVYLWDPQKVNKLEKSGYAVKRRKNALSLGVKLFARKKKHGFELKILPGMEVSVNDKRIKAEKVKTIEIEEGTKGTIYGEDGWSLDFYYYKGEYASYLSPSPVTPFLAQAYFFALFFLGGLMSVAFLTPSEEPLVSDISSRVKRMVTYEKKEEKHKKKPEITEEKEEKKKKQVFRLKVVRKQRAIHRRIRKIKAVKPVILKTHIKVKVAAPKLNNDEPIDLSEKGDGNTTDNSAQQGVGQNVAPVVVAPPPVVSAPPPPIEVQPPKPAKAPPVIKVRPKRLSFPYIEYPESAKNLGIEGKVKVRLYIDEKGRVYKVVVIKGLHPLLDKAAIIGAKKAKYKPALDQYGKPIKSTSVITITFRLEEE